MSQLIHKLENLKIDFLIMSDQIYFDHQTYQTHRFLSDELI